MGRSDNRKANKVDPKHAVDESEVLYISSYANALERLGGAGNESPIYDQVVYQLDFNPLAR